VLNKATNQLSWMLGFLLPMASPTASTQKKEQDYFIGKAEQTCLWRDAMFKGSC
jgi:hypothetical protein